jgi:hypothetical protein
MKYLISVFITYIINILFAFSYNDGKTVSISVNDSTKLKLLKWEYLFFISENDSDRYDALLEKVKINLERKEEAKAFYEIKRIEDLNKNILLEKQFYATLQGLLFNYALYDACLNYFEKDSLAPISVENLLMKSLCFNEELQYEEIKNTLRIASKLLNKDTLNAFRQLKNFNVKSSLKKSVLLQSILPGAGMINEGSFKEGITSFALNGLFVTAPILLFQQKLYFTAFSYGIFPLSKFYGGGIKHTKFLAQENLEKNMQIRKKENAKIIFQFFQP